MFVEVFTDGACLGNPGPGGYAVLIRGDGQDRTIVGGEKATTNNRMEMTAALMGLLAVETSSTINVFSDSQYVIKGITEWLPGWKSRGWRTADRKPVKNQDLWEKLDAAAANHAIKWLWVKGHNGHKENEQVDGLANAEAMKQSKL
jgi:ribonuclease HI